MSRTRSHSLTIGLVVAFCLLLTTTVSASGHVSIFVYHRFGDPRYPSTNIPIEDFRSHLEYLRSASFTVLTLTELSDKLASGEALPERCVALSIDDGYLSFGEHGWPLLQEYGYPATLFVNTETVGGDDFLDWPDLVRLQSEGVEIGNHSASHDALVDRHEGESDAERLARAGSDILSAQKILKEHLGRAPKFFSYPYGEYDPQLQSLVREIGFAAAFGQQSGVASSAVDLFAIPRFPMGGRYVDLEEFRRKLTMRPLSVRIVEPTSPIISGVNPPVLKLHLDLGEIEPESLVCYLPGENECLVRRDSADLSLYEVTASRPLESRRSKYTLTAKGRDGDNWHWFSQLWVLPGR